MSHFFEAIGSTTVIAKIQKLLKELNCLAPSVRPYTSGQVQKMFKRLYFWVKSSK